MSDHVRLVDPERPSLQELVTVRMAELDLSSRRAAERSGGRVSYETIRNILRGRHNGKVSDRVAEGLSQALDIRPVSRIYAAMGVPQPESRWDLPEELHRLPSRYRSEVENVARALLRALEDDPAH